MSMSFQAATSQTCFTGVTIASCIVLCNRAWQNWQADRDAVSQDHDESSQALGLVRRGLDLLHGTSEFVITGALNWVCQGGNDDDDATSAAGAHNGMSHQKRDSQV